VGEVAGKTAIVFDDMISSGQTMGRAVRACREHGAARVFAAASHGLFAPGARELLAEADGVAVTDSMLPFRQEQSLPERLAVVSCAGLFAQAVGRMHDGGSVSGLMAW
jgi:ribose-phosphate pyrophosphokinase